MKIDRRKNGEIERDRQNRGETETTDRATFTILEVVEKTVFTGGEG